MREISETDQDAPDDLDMRSVNISMTSASRDYIERGPRPNRSKQVRKFASILILAHEKGDATILPAMIRIIEQTNPRGRRESGATWEKVIIWIPKEMALSIERIIEGTGITESEFLRAAVIMATNPRDLPDVN